MAKLVWKPGTMLYPVPAAMISCKHGNVENIITISWTGTICTNPPMVSISVRPSRYSYELIKNSREFVINIPGRELAYAADYCGVRSGRDVDKFEVLSLGKEKASIVDVPLIAQAPLALECRVKDIVKLGSHDMFIAEVVAVNVDKKFVDEQDRLNLDKAELICYNHGKYCIAGEQLGKFGYSVEKPKGKASNKKRNAAEQVNSETGPKGMEHRNTRKSNTERSHGTGSGKNKTASKRDASPEKREKTVKTKAIEKTTVKEKNLVRPGARKAKRDRSNS